MLLSRLQFSTALTRSSNSVTSVMPRNRPPQFHRKHASSIPQLSNLTRPSILWPKKECRLLKFRHLVAVVSVYLIAIRCPSTVEELARPSHNLSETIAGIGMRARYLHHVL